MGEFANKAIGKTKRTVGKYTGNRSLQARGTLQEYKGRAQGAGREIGRTVRRGVRRAKASVGNRRARPMRRTVRRS